jgi:hypothetical protein
VAQLYVVTIPGPALSHLLVGPTPLFFFVLIPHTIQVVLRRMEQRLRLVHGVPELVWTAERADDVVHVAVV